jgi:NitT/TauT family transport system permease protein
VISPPESRPRTFLAEHSRAIATSALPKLGALVIVLVIWEGLVLLHWRPDYIVPSPVQVWGALGDQARSPDFYKALGITMSRALSGYAVALVIGVAIGVAMAVVPMLRSAVGSLITGLQTMPSIAWFPYAILLFGLNETAILFVVVLGAAPSIANGIITGIDNVPRQLTAAGRILGGRGLYLYRRVILPAAMPYVLAGLKQGWAFAWRSLMAGELIVIVLGRPSLGVKLNFAREFNDAPLMLALLVVLLAIGILVDYAFGLIDRGVRERRGLLRPAT